MQYILIYVYRKYETRIDFQKIKLVKWKKNRFNKGTYNIFGY